MIIKPKFKIDDWVKVNHPTCGTWEGEIYRIQRQDDTYEYWVTNAPEIFPTFPVLAWESEIEPAE